MTNIKEIFAELDVWEECCENLDALGATKSIVRIAKMSNSSPMVILYSIRTASIKNFDLPAMIMSNTLIEVVEGAN